jgi:predicted O-linked N-acetylglucosamine transferase (SPINDLY family)
MSRRQMLNAISPMALAALSDDPMFQLAKAWRYNQTFVGRPDTMLERRPCARKIGTGQRLRIGYLSSDLREHAVGFALSEVLELHDKTQVEIFAYYCGEARVNDPVQTRMRAAVDAWRDIAMMSDLEAAILIADDGIDILIDVNGYTKHARTKVVAHRPAPVIVNFCGYPGTMGSPYHHYIIADAEIIPPENEIFYSERVLRIPCNQPIDRKRPIAEERPSRAECGLPDDAFVFASFNGMQKVTPPCFQRWMTILSQVEGSVLWLLQDDPQTAHNLRREAVARGVDAQRLVFAQRLRTDEHLARHRVADLFLDTLPYNAHTTASDALWMGTPMVTRMGRTYISRMAASLLTAVGLPDLVTDSLAGYEKLAVDLGRQPMRVASYKRYLAEHGRTSPLFDLPRMVRDIEREFERLALAQRAR